VRFSFAAFMVYADITYASGAAEMLRLATTRPDLASLSTAQALYGLPTAGTCRNADGSSSACQNYILEITNRSSLAHELDRPEIFISGALHGDERIGPSTALALSRWLIERYDTDPWMRRLVDQRIILVMPMTNAIGVEQRRRDELGIDPNRDFPYDQVPSACMQTVTARSINELYRARLLQLVVTFHGGMQAIAYNWGSFNYYQSKPHRSPDDVSQRQVAEQMSKFAGTGGSRTRNTKYLFKTMNDLVYPVHGGMEDWGYAASWDRAFVRTCEPRTYGGYEAARTTYSDAAVRAFTVLIETSDLKAPTADTYGAEAGVYNINGDADGHVPRNVRLSLAAIDLVRPHVAAWREGEATAAAAGSEVGAPVSAGGCVPLQWIVWGAIQVEAATPVCRRDATAAWIECGDTQSGPGVWGGDSTPLTPHTFRGCARVPVGAVGGAYQVAVRAKVDTAWSRRPAEAFAPLMDPQSHLALSRKEGYTADNHGHKVSGHSSWLSAALGVMVAGGSTTPPPSPSPSPAPSPAPAPAPSPSPSPSPSPPPPPPSPPLPPPLFSTEGPLSIPASLPPLPSPSPYPSPSSSPSPVTSLLPPPSMQAALTAAAVLSPRASAAGHAASAAACRNARSRLTPAAEQRRSLEHDLPILGRRLERHARRRRLTASIPTTGMFICVPLAPPAEDCARAAAAAASSPQAASSSMAAAPPAPCAAYASAGDRLTAHLAILLASRLDVPVARVRPAPVDVLHGAVVLQLGPPNMAREPSAQTLAVQATSWLRGASIVVADASALANAAALVDEGAEPVSALALPLDSSDDPAEPAVGLLTQLDDAWHGRAPTLLVMMLVGAAALVLLLCGLAGCLLRVRGGGGAVRPSEAEIARLRNKYECRVAQAEALSLLTDTQTDGETSTGSGSRP
jgi:hypothetical protein